MRTLRMVGLLVMSLVVSTPALACDIKQGEVRTEPGEVNSFGDLRIRFMGFDEDKQVFRFDIKAPSYEERKVDMVDDSPIIRKICGQEVTINIDKISLSLVYIRVGVF